MHTRMLVRAGLAAVPYLIRQQQWTVAAALLERAFLRDPSRANAAAMLPAIRQATRHDPQLASALALVQQVLDAAAAETVMRDALATSVAAGDYRAASVTTSRLVDLCRDSGRLADALDLADQQIDYTRRAGLGPWTQLSSEVQRLQVLNDMGQASQVLAEVTGSATTWPPSPPPETPTRPPLRGTSARHCSTPAERRPPARPVGRRPRPQRRHRRQRAGPQRPRH